MEGGALFQCGLLNAHSFTGLYGGSKDEIRAGYNVHFCLLHFKSQTQLQNAAAFAKHHQNLTKTLEDMVYCHLKKTFLWQDGNFRCENVGFSQMSQTRGLWFNWIFYCVKLGLYNNILSGAAVKLKKNWKATFEKSWKLSIGMSHWVTECRWKCEILGCKIPVRF